MSGRMVAGLVVLAACGGNARPLDAPAPRPSAPTTPSEAQPSDPLTPSEAQPSRGAPPDPRVQLATALDTAGVRDFMIEEGERDTCRGIDAPYRVLSAAVSDDDGVSCIVPPVSDDGTVAPSCVVFAGHRPSHVEAVLCAVGAAPAAATPSWLPPLLAAALPPNPGEEWSVSSVASPSKTPALALLTDDGPHLLTRGARWQVTAEPLVESFGRRPSVERVVDTAGLAGGPWIAVVVDQYDGGSEMGEAVTSLILLDASGPTLRERTRMQIGGFVWQLAAADRHRIKDPSNLRARPHLEVELTPSFDAAGTLTLTRKRVTLPARKRGEWEDAPCREDDDCRFTRMQAIERAAGRWRFDGQTFVR